MNLLGKIKSYFNKNIGTQIDEKSYLGVDIEEVYGNVDNTYKVCEQYLAAKRDKERVAKEYEENVKKYATLQQVEGLKKGTLAELENYANTYMETAKHKVEYVDRIKGTGEEYDYLGEYEEDIQKVITNIKNTEERQRAVKNDIHCIEGEKAELGYRATKLVGTQKMVKIIMITLLMVFALSTFILLSLYQTSNIDIMMPAIIMILIIGFFGMWIYIFRRYVVHEINKNHLLRKRAVELLNKIKLKYVHHEQFLEYEYKKYRVKSGDMLEDRWQKYNQSRQDKQRIHKISRNIITAEEDIERLLTKNQISIDGGLFEAIEYYMSKSKRSKYKQELEKNIQTLRDTMEEYDRELRLITQLLQDVSAKDHSNDQAIAKMIHRLNL